MSELHRAVAAGDLDRVRQLLDEDFPVDQRDGDGATALHWAAADGEPLRVDIQELLGDPGSSPHGRPTVRGVRFPTDPHLARGFLRALHRRNPGIDPKIPLHEPLADADRSTGWPQAFRVGQTLDQVLSEDAGQRWLYDALVDQGLDIQRLDPDLANQLLYPFPAVPLSELLLERGASPHAQDEDGETPLHWAAAKGSPSVVPLLLEHGAEINAVASTETTGNGATPLYKAVEAGRLDIVRLLIERGALVDFGDDDEAPIHQAAGWGNPAILQQLIDHGADLEVLDHNDRTPLLRAVEANHPEALEILLGAGARPQVQDFLGRTPLHFEISQEIIRRLVAAGCDLETEDSEGWRPLHRAAADVDLDRCRDLVRAGADIHAHTADGWSVLHCLFEADEFRGREPAVVRYLISQGADPKSEGTRGRSPLAMAREQYPKYTELIQALSRQPSTG